MKFRFNRIRIAFAQDIWNARQMEDGEGAPKFNFEAIVSTNHPQLAAFEAEQDRAGKEKFGDKWPTLKPKLEKENRLVLRKSPRTNKDGEVYDGYEDNYWIRASSKVRPLIAHANKSILTEADGVIYSGCYVNAVIETFGHHHAKGGNRVLAEIKVIQFAGHGDAFGGGVRGSLDDIDEVEVGEEATDLV